MKTVNLWHELCYDLAKKPKICIAGSRKILRGVTWSVPHIDDSMQLWQMGYARESSNKISQLIKYYVNQNSVDKAVSDYTERVMGKSYGSVGVTTYGEEKKGFTKQGQCIQAFTLTQLPGQKTEMDIFYRTTEVMKKFGADVVFFRDIIIPQFEEPLKSSPLVKINFHFANASIHPMFFCLLAVSDPSWFNRMKEVEKEDPQFYTNVMKWTMRNMEGRLDAAYLTSRRVGKGMWDELGPAKFNRLKREVRRILK